MLNILLNLSFFNHPNNSSSKWRSSTYCNFLQPSGMSSQPDLKILFVCCKIWGFHSSEDSGWGLLACDTL